MDEQKLGEVIAGIDFLKGQVQRLDERVVSELNRIDNRLERISSNYTPIAQYDRLHESVQSLWNHVRQTDEHVSNLESRAFETRGIASYTREILTVLLAAIVAAALAIYF